MAEVTRFYRDVLGLRETRRHDDGHGLRSVWLSAGPVLLMIERSSHPRQTLELPSQERASAGTPAAGSPNEEAPSEDTSSPERSDERSQRPMGSTQNDALRLDAPGYHLVAFRIERDEHEAWRRHLQAHQHPIVHETSFTIYVSDPDGNRVGMSSWPEARRP